MNENEQPTSDNSQASDPSQSSESTTPSFDFGADTTPNQPTPTMEKDSAEALPQKAKSSKKKWFLLGGVILIVLILAGLVGAYFWYQSPSKVVSDSVLNLTSVKTATMDGQMVAATKDYRLTLALNGGSNASRDGKADATLTINALSGDMKGQTFKVNGSFVATNDGTAYFKLSGLEKLINVYVDTLIQGYASSGAATEAQIAQIKSQIRTQLDPVVKKIDGQWVKVSPSDFNSSSDSKDSYKCVQDAIKSLQDDTSMQNDLKDAYQKNQFITIKKSLGLKDGSYGYQLTYDKSKENNFEKAAKDTTFGKKLSACDDSMSSTDSDSSSDDDYTTTFTLWVSQWSHQITRIEAVGDPKVDTDPKFTVNLNTDMNKSTDVKAPTNAKSLKELESEFETLSPMASGL